MQITLPRALLVGFIWAGSLMVALHLRLGIQHDCPPQPVIYMWRNITPCPTCPPAAIAAEHVHVHASLPYASSAKPPPSLLRVHASASSAKPPLSLLRVHASSSAPPPPVGALSAPLFVGAPTAANFTLVFMWNFKIDEGHRAYLNQVYGRFFRFVTHVGGDDACNTGFVGVTHNKTRVAQYVCFGALMAQEPGAFGTLGFLFLADDLAICPTEMIAELSDSPRVPRYAGSDRLREADALILEHVRDGPNSTFFAAGTAYTKWVWADQFPTVKRALLDSDAILSQTVKRQISARLGDRCARAAAKSVDVPRLTLPPGRRGRGINCFPRPEGGNSDVVYMPRGESALTFAKHARAIKETGISTEIALPIIMYTLSNPPGHFAGRGRSKLLWGANRREAARYIGGNASASSTVACWQSVGVRCSRPKSPHAGDDHYVKHSGPLPTNKFGCACLFVHPLKLSDAHNKETLTAFLNRQHELFVGGT